MAADTKPKPFATIFAISGKRPLTYADLMAEGMPYETFLVNRAFSLSEDSVLAASIMNQRPHLDKEMQATFYIHSLRPRRRLDAWPKALVDEQDKVIAAYYGMSLREAKLHRHLHTEEQLESMRVALEGGGRPSRFGAI